VRVQDVKPYDAPASLDDLRGPRDGELVLPHHVHWGPRRDVNLSREGDVLTAQREITRLALRSLDGTSFVLAGSGAIREHGLVDRPTEDVDLFTSDVDLQQFSAAVDADQFNGIKNRFEVWASTLRGDP